MWQCSSMVRVIRSWYMDMERSTILLLVLIATVVPAGRTSHGDKGKATSSRPNILFLMADQMRADMMGCAGNPVVQTPNLDRLASLGVRFRNAFSSTPTCTPARAAILTGLSPWYHGLLGAGFIASHYNVEMPRTLSGGGYYTFSIGKDHFGWNSTTNEGISHGYDGTQLYDGLPVEADDYDEWMMQADPGVDPMATGLEYNDYRGRAYALPEFYHPTAWVGRAAVNFLEKYNNSVPFFLKVSFHRPHSPYDPPERWLDQYKPEDMPAPFLGDDWDSRYAIHYNGTPNPGIWCGDLGLKQAQLSRQAYYASVSFVDEWIGQIIGTLEKLSLASNTFIVFTADHGDMMSDHYHWRKGYPYYGAASIPMLLIWPTSMERPNGREITVPRGSVLNEVTELRDLFPTFLDTAEVKISSTLNGSSLLNLLRYSYRPEKDQNPSDLRVTWREYVDLEHDICYNVTNHWNALTDGRMKYIFQAYFPGEQLFDLSYDPGERYNLAGFEDWQEELVKWRKRMVEQFEREGRGPDWVRDGMLMRRVKGQMYSPHYPKQS